MAVITISRQTGSGGEELAEQLVHELGYRLVDKELLTQVAALAHVPVEQIADYETAGAESFVRRFLHGVARGLPDLDDYYQAFARVPADQGPTVRHYIYYGHQEGPQPVTHLRQADCLRYFESAIRELGERGHVTIIGRAAQVLLADLPHTLHLRTIAGEPYRVDRIARKKGLDKEAALKLIRDDESHRESYLLTNYHRQVDDPSLYDMVFRMDRLSLNSVVRFVREWVVEEAKKHQKEIQTPD
jgi:cytidylate kinase